MRGVHRWQVMLCGQASSCNREIVAVRLRRTATHTHNSNVSSNTWCTRKNLCVPRNWEFRHATRILDVIMLKYPLKMRPMPGMWVQSVPVTAIPWGGMNTEQRNTLQRSVRQDD